MPSKEIILDILKKVIDPELFYDIVSLGLIREIIINQEKIKIIMTLTTPICPFADFIIQDIKDNIINAGFDEPEIELTFDPPWECPENIKINLNI